MSGGLIERQLKAAETPYVVLLGPAQQLAQTGGRGGWEKIQDTWTFEHLPSEWTPIVRDANGEWRQVDHQYTAQLAHRFLPTQVCP